MSFPAGLRLYFLRHGQTENFENPPFNGWRDAPLTDFGKTQLETAARALKNLPLDAVYSSDLSRAVYGGERLAEAVGCHLNIDSVWREIHFGRWEGLTWAEIIQREGEAARRIFNPEGSDLSFPGGESSAGFFQRIGAALRALRERHPVGRVALVAHSGVCRALLGNLLHLRPAAIWSLHQDYACLNVADLPREGHPVVRLVNGYLGPEGYYQAGPGADRLIN